MIEKNAFLSLETHQLAERLLPEFGALALEAGCAIMRVYETGPTARLKSDQSPVSEADEKAEEIILAGLARVAPDLSVIAEEATAAGHKVEPGAVFILVDPLDGTREFLNKNADFTVNIALIAHGAPIAGAVFAPARDSLWLGCKDEAFVCRGAPGASLPERADWRPIRARRREMDLTALASRSHGDAQTEAILDRLPLTERISAGSSLKFCLIAEGEADVYPRCGPTMEWDTAAGDAVLRAAGGLTVDLAGAPLRYGRIQENFRNSAFIAWGRVAPRIQALARQ